MSFREETRAWLEENCPRQMRTPGSVTNGGRHAKLGEEQRAWLDRMASKGWTAPTWPAEYGGGGLSVEDNQILTEEMRRINARAPLAGHGLTMIGPAILEFGTEEQCLEHLPKIASGEVRWCQGYSEPGAGSDLASLQCRAMADGDDYIINGSKIWTSGADQADWIFSLVRTDTAKKHEGISFMVFDMTSEGVSISPIELISGSSEFCQTFFDDVRVPKKQMISTPGNGWTVGKRLLQYERTSIGGIGGSNQKITTIDEHAMNYLGANNGKISDPAIRDAVTSLRMDEHAYQLTTRRSAEEAISSKAPTFMSSFFKVYGTEQNKERTELLVHIMGTNGLGWEGDGFNGGELGATRNWLRSKANSIEGGTSEVMLNIISKRILGLPD
ncbi:MAG: acyl-CoA dehydrogenase [Gammaproteobacteria bacterium]|nr:acyl-CoA dehydrogenase [Gammaproteobacteria bacterium]OUU10306.1 MAG: acyl-CoA dehydrogenase [Gammaproteobacteria bacterium TMED34]